MTHTYDVRVTREGEFWIIEVPELKGLEYAHGAVNCSTITQARREGEIERQARDFIATVTDCEPFEFNVAIKRT